LFVDCSIVVLLPLFYVSFYRSCYRLPFVLSVRCCSLLRCVPRLHSLLLFWFVVCSHCFPYVCSFRCCSVVPFVCCSTDLLLRYVVRLRSFTTLPVYRSFSSTFVRLFLRYLLVDLPRFYVHLRFTFTTRSTVTFVTCCSLRCTLPRYVTACVLLRSDLFVLRFVLGRLRLLVWFHVPFLPPCLLPPAFVGTFCFTLLECVAFTLRLRVVTFYRCVSLVVIRSRCSPRLLRVATCTGLPYVRAVLPAFALIRSFMVLVLFVRLRCLLLLRSYVYRLFVCSPIYVPPLRCRLFHICTVTVMLHCCSLFYVYSYHYCSTVVVLPYVRCSTISYVMEWVVHLRYTTCGLPWLWLLLVGSAPFAFVLPFRCLPVVTALLSGFFRSPAVLPPPGFVVRLRVVRYVFVLDSRSPAFCRSLRC